MYSIKQYYSVSELGFHEFESIRDNRKPLSQQQLSRRELIQFNKPQKQTFLD